MSLIELVVARHEEDVSWTRNTVSGIRITLYNKGGFLPGALSLPNEGREAHTYLHHIVHRYHDLSPVTVFCQGHPFDHCSRFHAILRDLAAPQAPVPSFQWLGFIIDWDDNEGKRLFQPWSKNEGREQLAMTGFCSEVLAETGGEPFVFYPGAQFIASRELILSRPLPFYERALEVAVCFPHAAHCFERTWDRVFGINGIPEEHRNQPLPLYLKPIRRLMS